MGRRVLAFFLGMLFGIIFIVGAVAGAIYIAVCVVKVDKYVPEADKYLGTLANMSAYDIAKNVYDLYGQKTGFTDEEGNYYTLGQFLANYNIDPETAFGMALPDDILSIPAFEFFTEGGFERALTQVKVSAIPAIINLFGDENGLFGETVMTELSKFSVADLFSEEVGFKGVFANVKLADVMPDAFPAENSDNKLMWAVGQTTIGGALSGMSGSDNILLQLKQGNAFATIGELEVSAVLGTNRYVTAILGEEAVVSDLISDSGHLRLDEIIDDVAVGELLGCQKNLIASIDGYVAIDGQDGEAKKAVLQKIENDVAVYVKEDRNHWYEAELDCDDETEGHTHNNDCYVYVWYSTQLCNNNHNHDLSDDLQKDGDYFPKVNGLYSVLSALSVADLTKGNDNALMNKIKKLTVRDVVNESDVSGVMEALLDLTIEELMGGAIDELYLGEFFRYTRKLVDAADYYSDTLVDIRKHRNDTFAYKMMTNGDGAIALSVNGKDWYEGQLSCTIDEEGHNHTTDDCYGFAWYQIDGSRAEGIQGKFASKQIADLLNINEEVKKLTLGDVFGEDIPAMLKPIADTQIKYLSDDLEKILIGEMLEYTYELTCEHQEGDVHNYSCYIWTDQSGERVDGMMAKIACKQLGEMRNLNKIIRNEFTMGDVFGENPPRMLKSLTDTTIGELGLAIDNMYLGEFLGYTYEITCNQELAPAHVHSYECYVWRTEECSVTTPDHVHSDECYIVKGMMAKLACQRVSELNDLQKTIKTFTLKDVLGDDVPEAMIDMQDTEIGNLQKAIDNMYLGSAMGYQRIEVADISDYRTIITAKNENRTPLVKQLTDMSETYVKSEDGKTWYTAYFECEDRSHQHTADCYKYVWQDKDTHQTVEGVTKAFVNSKLSNMSDTMDNLTIRKLNINIADNNILKNIQDVKLTEIGPAINKMKMGDVLGFEKYYLCQHTKASDHDENCEYVWVEVCNDNHDTSLPDNHFATDEHYVVGDVKYVAVKGLNKKIAMKSIDQMDGSGLSEISRSLTMADLIDSGMMNVGGAENEYKLAIIFCGDDEHCMDETKFNGEHYACNLQDYMIYATAHSGTTAQSYWKSCHGITSDEDMTESKQHFDEWKNLLLSEFVTELLNAMTVTND